MQFPGNTQFRAKFQVFWLVFAAPYVALQNFSDLPGSIIIIIQPGLNPKPQTLNPKPPKTLIIIQTGLNLQGAEASRLCQAAESCSHCFLIHRTRRKSQDLMGINKVPNNGESNGKENGK